MESYNLLNALPDVERVYLTFGGPTWLEMHPVPAREHFLACSARGYSSELHQS